MKNRYIDLIEQSFDFPQQEFTVSSKDELLFHDIHLMELVRRYGSPLKITYLPKISENINLVKKMFNKAFKKLNYKGEYFYCYCTKSSHFKPVIEEALKNNIHIETSSAVDIDIIWKLFEKGSFSKDRFVVCNGYKRDAYIEKIASLINNGFENTLPIIDNFEELDLLSEKAKSPFKIGIRIASEEEPKFEFYTSRLGIGYKDVLPFYSQKIEQNKNVKLTMLHFFINTGIKDTAYYWNELHKCLKVYVKLKKRNPDLKHLNIGGGFPIKNSLGFSFDYDYLVYEIVNQINLVCKEAGVEVPNIFTEFGSYTVGESGAMLYKVLGQKKQNEKEKWNMINSSFITTLPDSWSINSRFVMLPLNRWRDKYERVLLGGLTCDSDDYYNSEQHVNAIYLPEYNENNDLYIGFFNTGAYQETIGGYGGLQHCLIPQPKHLLVQKNEDAIEIEVFKDEQKPEEFLSILGY